MLPALAGFFTGILSAWGIGGGTLLLLVMSLFLGVDQITAQGINLLYFLPTAAMALVQHRKNGLLDAPVLGGAIPWGLPAAALGAFLATAADVAALKKPFGVFLLVVPGFTLFSARFPGKIRYGEALIVTPVWQRQRLQEMRCRTGTAGILTSEKDGPRVRPFRL